MRMQRSASCPAKLRYGRPSCAWRRARFQARRVQPITRSSSAPSRQTESSEYIHPKARSPNAVASAATAAVAPPTFQSELIDLSEGDAAAFSMASSMAWSVSRVSRWLFQ
jgi:hypothetical protein